MAEGARGLGQPRGVAVGTDRGRLEVALALDREGAGEDLVADPPGDRLGLAGQLRLVERQPIGAHQVTVGGDLVAAGDPHQVADHDLADEHLPRRPVPDHGRFRHHQRRELVEGALGAHLLEGPDRDVGDEDAEEERVLRVAPDDRRGAEAGEDRVEDGEGVGDRDREVGAAGRLLAGRAALLQAARGLLPRSVQP